MIAASEATRSEGATQRKDARLENGAEPPLYDLIELMFFAYRDFVGDADRLLDSYRFGRAHHRVLHFVHRHPGLSVAELLDILKITKQSLSRVMKELLDAGLVAVRSGASDRRQRLLTLSPAGDALAATLAAAQSRRFAAALRGMSEGAREQAADFLLRLVDPAERSTVMGLVGQGMVGQGIVGQGIADHGPRAGGAGHP